MFQQGSKSHSNSLNWKHHHLHYKNFTDKYRDNDNPTQKASKFPNCLKTLNILKTINRTATSKKTGLRKANSIYSVISVKERCKNDAGSNTGINLLKVKQSMTNTLSVMANVLRNVVSKKRIRYKGDGFNLDLCYITDHVIAMGYPAQYLESIYRNSFTDVYRFLEDCHSDKYKVYNLCLERHYDISKFHGRVSVYPFEDHNPPTIELILAFCEDVSDWLQKRPENVAVVHCKAGKGRTGTMICCYLVYSKLFPTAEDALALYDEKRTKDRKGVTIPSQKRYVKYFSSLIQSNLKYERRTLQFLEIRFSNADSLVNQGTAQLLISSYEDKVMTLLSNIPVDFKKKTSFDITNAGLPVTGDIKVEVTKNTKKLFHFWFNTYFVIQLSEPEGVGTNVRHVYSLLKHEVDGAHKNKSYGENFKVDLVFAAEENYPDSAVSSRPTSDYRLSSQSPSTSQQAKLFPQGSSVHSGMSSISDLKSTSTSSSSGFGVSRSIIGEGDEKALEKAQRSSDMASDMEATDANEATDEKHVMQPPCDIDEQHQAQKRTRSPDTDVVEEDPLANVSDNMSATSQPSTSQASSVSSSQSSSSAIGEDWESAKRRASKIDITQKKEIKKADIEYSSEEVIEPENVKPSGSKVATSALAETGTIEPVSESSNDQYNQQRSKQIKLDIEAQQQEKRQSLTQTQLQESLISEDFETETDENTDTSIKEPIEKRATPQSASSKTRILKDSNPAN